MRSTLDWYGKIRRKIEFVIGRRGTEIRSHRADNWWCDFAIEVRLWRTACERPLAFTSFAFLTDRSPLSEDLFSGFVCIDLNAIAGGNMRVREHLEFGEPV
jgi:hypothetical protein